MARRKKVYEGKAKILYEGPEPGTLIQYFKDDGTPTPVDPAPVTVDGKGVLNNRLSEFFMAGLNAIGVPTHFIRRINMREQLVRMVEIIPLEVVVRNFAAGDISQRLGIPEGTPLPRPIVEYYFKDDKLGTPLVSEEHIVAFGWANPDAFDPDRWQTAEGRESSRQAYMPFSAGPRVCTGAGFAMVEGPLLLALLVRAFRFGRIAGKDPIPVAHLTVRAKDGIALTVSRRQSAAKGAGPA